MNVKKPKGNWKKALLLTIGILIGVRILISVIGMVVYFLISNVAVPEREPKSPEPPIWVDDDGNVTILDDGSEEFF